MTTQFLAEPWPGDDIRKAFADISPDNPFNTWAYAAARAVAGVEPWSLAVVRGQELDAGCYGFLRRGRISSRLEVHSLPELQPETPFWEGLVRLCDEQKIDELQINSFGSSSAKIPLLRRELERRDRCEFRLHLTKPSLWQDFSSNHKRNIKRAKKAEMALVQCGDAEAAAVHAEVQVKSMRRREARGEQVSLAADPGPSRALIDHGAGQLFQAIWNGQVVSSLLVLRAAKGAYYHSAGSTPEGMASGAAHFLVSAVAERLRDEGLELFNLGGAGSADDGLARFKSGFGAEPTKLVAARFLVCPPLRRVLYVVGKAVRPLMGRG